MIKQKIKIVEYAPSVVDPNILVAYTADGGRIELVLCRVPEKRRTNGKLYTNGKHDFFSLTSRGLRQVFEHLTPTSRTPGRSCHNGKRGNIYPQMREYGNATCHSLVCTAFHGPRPIVNGILYVCDHKNGNIMDWSEDNLEWVSPRENAKRRAILKALRMCGRDPLKMSYAELDEIFRRYQVSNPADIIEYEMSHHCEC
jgi:hypothetical protein